MKFSTFNHIHNIDGKIILFNTLYQGVLELDGEYIEKFKQYQETGICDEEMLSNLKKGGFIVEDNFDEVKSYKLSSTIDRFNGDCLSLTIAPTLECNFACTYCFEKGKRYNTMSQETMEDLIKFVETQMENYSSLGVVWYGGEPLLALDKIEALTKEFKRICGDKKSYDASIVTNGYNLTGKVAHKLKDFGITSSQVTLDGVKEVHDSRRFTVKREGTFDKILDNLKESCEILPIIVRINIDKDNVKESQELLDIIEDNGLNGKVSYYVAAVDDINETCTNTSCLSNIEFSKFETDFYNQAMERGIYEGFLPTPALAVCGAVSLHSYVIDPLGDLYKCWNNVGYKEESIGNINTNVINRDIIEKWLTYEQVEGECESCSVLPICSGGCPHNYVQSGKHQCNSCKNNLDDMVNLFYRLKKSKELCKPGV